MSVRVPRLGTLLEPSWVPRGLSWRHLGAVLGPSWAILGTSWRTLGRPGGPWGRLGASGSGRGENAQIFQTPKRS
eukprot:7003026-Pyramimonas_sp.AAC.1